MPGPYKELLSGETYIRSALSKPHELLCDRLHAAVAAHLPANSALRLLRRRAAISLCDGVGVRPDLALVRSPSAQLYLAVEVLLPGDHHPDTVLKKQLYADARLPRLWIVDSRYQNTEIYGTGEFGFRLEAILAGRETLTDPALTGLALSMNALFEKV